MARFWIAAASLAAVGATAWFTLSDDKFRYGVLVILAGFAVKMWTEQKRRAANEQEVGRE